MATFARAYTRPLPAVLLPLMIVSLAVALQDGNVTPFLTLYFPLAFAGCAAWALFWLYRRTVEVRLDGQGVCLRTAWEVATDQPCRWHAVYGVRYGVPWIAFAWGHTAVELNETEWPEAPALLQALRTAALDFRPQPA